MTPFVDGLVVRNVSDAISFGGDDGLRSMLRQRGAQMVRVKRLVRKHRAECEPFDQFRHADNFAALAREKLEADKVAKCVRERQDFCRQTAFRAAYGLILSPPFAPLAFW